VLGEGEGLAGGLADALGGAPGEGPMEAGAVMSGEATAATAGGADPGPDARRYTPPPTTKIRRTKATDRSRRSERRRLVIPRSM
jgi:hypothetical protein